jgi:formylmethanofuran dehydrogenase subunit E
VATAIKLLLSLLPILQYAFNWFKRRQEKEEARVAVEAEIKSKEAEKTREAARIIAESRPDDDASKRLHKGDF